MVLVEADGLRRHLDPRALPFASTRELERPETAEAPGQSRALAALSFAMDMRAGGYHVFAMGPEGMGKRETILRYLQRNGHGRQTLSDWCYIYDFDEPSKPRLLRLPPGMGRALRRDVTELVADLQVVVPAAFENAEYQSRLESIKAEFRNRRRESFQELEKEAREKGFAIVQTPLGFAFAPLKDGEVLDDQGLQGLTDEERKQYHELGAQLQQRLQDILKEAPRQERKQRERIRALNEEVTRLAVEHLIDDLRTTYANQANVVDFLHALQYDVIANVPRFLDDEEKPQAENALPRTDPHELAMVKRYEINVLVSHDDAAHPPVIHEDRPTLSSLVGRIEYEARMGALLTNFTLIKPGALHRANGGYLILDARRVLVEAFAWDALKRALTAQVVQIESPMERMGWSQTRSLEPEPIPLDVKVVLLGDRRTYYLLSALDPDFPKLFKVCADFEEATAWNDGTPLAYARLAKRLIEEEGLHPFTNDAIALLIEECSRAVEDRTKLATELSRVRDLLCEAHHVAAMRHAELVTREDLENALALRVERVDRVRDLSHEAMQRGLILIETAGERVGQINGLSVLQIGEFQFGRPTRITATARIGRGEIVDIEREVELGGPLHTKGVLILAGYLGNRFARCEPLSISARIVFEQSYGMVDGDSASSAELYALLSAIAQVPLKQCYAVTGSVNQYGEVQAIGGVNHKIEGFFDLCRARGLTGEQGVLIPASNVEHLMLRSDVVEAVRAGRFQVHAISSIDEGLEVLTGLPRGVPDEEGRFADDTLQGRVQRALSEFSERARESENSKQDGSS